MFPVRKKPWPTMGGVLFFVQHGGRDRRAALCAHFQKRVAEVRTEHDHVIRAPRATTRIRSIGYNRDRSSRHGDLVQLPVSEESDVPTIRRPEGMDRALRAFELLHRVTFQRAYPKGLGVRGMSDKGNLVALG